MPERLDQNTTDQTVDLIVIGAGINGAGIARDAALRGLNVLLLDKGDIGSGTSSASTRLIHGGLRYLEHAEFGLVRESLREREILFRIAPHLVRPLPILMPIYENARRGKSVIRAGMVAYDLLSLGKSVARHRMLSREGALHRAPGLNADGLCGAALYHDAQVEFAERLVLENALAARESGAIIATYARVDRVIVEGKIVCGVEFTDLKTRQTRTAGAPVTINASGPWVDRLVDGLGFERMIGGTKGSHVVVAPFAGAPATALYIEAASDQRPFFIIPWNENFLIGTTNIRYEGDPDAVEINDEEIAYLLAETNRVIPDARLTRKSILFTYSGVRPLAYSENTDEQTITRRHFIHDHSPGLSGFVSVVGGKLTTYRSLAEQAVNLIFRKLGRPMPACTTDKVPLPGALTAAPSTGEIVGTSPKPSALASDFILFCEKFKRESGLPELVSERLLRIYGTRAVAVLRLVSEDPALGETFSEETGALAAEIVFAFRHELAQTLADCLLRRTMVGLSSSRGIGADEAAASIAQKFLDWSTDRAQCEVLEYRKAQRLSA